MTFRRAGGRRKKENWLWNGREIEEVDQFKYLGYTLQRNNRPDRHIKETVKKAISAMKQVWGIGQRKFEGDFRRRIWMFNHLVKNILMYGAEIWGWNEYAVIERCQDKYIKWSLGLDWNTPGYIVREETKTKVLRIESGKRAVKFEEKIRESTPNRILKECIIEIEKARQNKTRWEIDRELYFRRNGMSGEEIKRIRERGGDVIVRLTERDIEIQKQIQFNRIQESRFGKKYKELYSIEIPEYLRKPGKKDHQKIIARFRCGNEELSSNFWRDQEEILCRICQKEVETIEHLSKRCREEMRSNMSAVQLLTGKGEGISWMKKIIKIRAENRTKDQRAF
jgi:hypothetical protein